MYSLISLWIRILNGRKKVSIWKLDINFRKSDMNFRRYGWCVHTMSITIDWIVIMYEMRTFKNNVYVSPVLSDYTQQAEKGNGPTEWIANGIKYPHRATWLKQSVKIWGVFLKWKLRVTFLLLFRAYFHSGGCICCNSESTEELS